MINSNVIVTNRHVPFTPMFLETGVYVSTFLPSAEAITEV